MRSAIISKQQLRQQQPAHGLAGGCAAHVPRRGRLAQPSRRDWPSTGGPECCSATAVLQDASPARSPSRATSPSRSPPASTSAVVQSFFDALNARDISGVLHSLADDIVHQDLAHEQAANSKLEVAKFYLDLFASLAPNMKFVVEDITDGNPSCVGVAWHLAVEGNELPMSKGLGFYKFNSRRKICFIRQSPEHFVKVANLALSATGMASPLVHALGPAATPSFWSNVVDNAASALAGSAPMEGMSQLLGSFSVDAALSSFMPTSQAEPNKALMGFSSPPSSSHAPGMTRHGHGGGRTSQGVGSGPHPGSPAHPTSLAGGAGSASSLMAMQAAAALQASAVATASTAPPVNAPTATSPVLASSAPAMTVGPVSAQQLAYALAAAAAASAATTPCAAADAEASTLPALEPDTDVPISSSALAAIASTAMTAEGQSAPASAPFITAAAVVSVLEPAAAPAAPPAPVEVSARGPVNLTGIWSKVPELSDLEAYEKALDLWQISGMQRATARLIEGLEIKHQGERFDVHHLTVIPYFKVTEIYEVGKQTKVMRRDLRSGKATATAQLLHDKSGVMLDVSFGAPFPGRLEEVYHSPEPGVMHVTSTVFLRDQSVSTCQVYRLQSLSKQEFLAQSEKRNGKANDILRKFGAPL